MRGTAFGLFDLTGGLAMLTASVIAGALWDVYGPTATFAAGAAITAVSLIGFAFVRVLFVPGVETTGSTD